MAFILNPDCFGDWKKGRKINCAESVIKQFSLYWATQNHSSRVPIFTDDSCSKNVPSIAVWAPAKGFKLKAGLGNVTAPTTAELVSLFGKPYATFRGDFHSDEKKFMHGLTCCI